MSSDVTRQTKRNDDPDFLFPKFWDRVYQALEAANRDGYQLSLFEGWRSVDRQNHLYSQGRERPGSKITNAKGWQSWHQYGVAADVVFKYNGRWSWEGPWDKVEGYFTDFGLENPLEWDKPHWQWTGGMKIKTAEKLAKGFGLQTVWHEIYRSL